MYQFVRSIVLLSTDANALRIFSISALKSIALTAACIFINILGFFVSKMADNILFLDFCGTIAIAMIYGPIHAALVGIVSIYAGQLYLKIFNADADLYGLGDYFLFGPVHMAIGAVAFFVPRLLRGQWSFDFFCGNEKKYPAGRLLISMILLALLTNLASSATVAAIMSIDSLNVTCGDLLQRNLEKGSYILLSEGSSGNYSIFPQIKSTSNYQQLCEFAQLLFNDIGNETDYYFLKLLLFKFIIGFPDHLVCFPSAVVVIAYVLDSRRYRMSGKFAQTLITNHPAVGTIYFFLFLGFVFLYTRDIYNYAGMWAAFLTWNFYNVFIVCISFMIVNGRFNVWWLKQGHEHVIRRRYTYKKLNITMKDAYEDSMKFAILYSTTIYFILTWLKTDNGADDVYKTFKEKLIGALGVVVIISLIRYLTLIIARVGRYWAEPWRREKQKRSEGQRNDRPLIG